MTNSIKKKLLFIIKSFGYSILFLLYGKIKGIIDSTKHESIEIFNTTLDENYTYKIFQIKNCRIYTDTVTDTAFIIDNKIINGPSFQHRNPKNAEVSENIVFQKGTPKLKKKLSGAVFSLLTGGGGNANYWHWLFDVLPRIKIANKILDYKKIDKFLVPSIKKKFQIQSLDLLNIEKKKILTSNKFRHISTSSLIVTDHPYVLMNNPSIEIQQMQSWIIEWLRNSFLVKSNISKSVIKKIYLERNNFDNKNKIKRKITNEEEIKSTLLKKDFYAINPEILSFSEQINLFSNADFIIGLHGAAFANIVFSKKNTKILEIQSTGTGDVIKNLAIKSDLIYDNITIKPHLENINNQDGHLFVPIDVLKKKIE